MRELYSNELVRGNKYRIQHKLGLLTPKLGTFVRAYYNPINTYNDFDTIIDTPMPRFRDKAYVRMAFDVKNWAFYESGEMLMAEQVTRGLCYRIPEECAAIIQDFLTGRRLGTGPSRYPLRQLNAHYN